MNKQVNFDDYTDKYESLLENQLAFFSKDRSYFSSYKIDLVDKLIDVRPNNILDFGCGIGLSLPFLRDRFIESHLYASDESTKSLAHVKKNHPYAQILTDHELNNHRFDFIFVAGVLHHVPVAKRQYVMQRLATLLNSDGILAIFEHNPFNPVTRHMVSTCPFDKDATLLSLRSEKKLVTTASELMIFKSGYCLFLPQFLKILSPYESLLRWLPLGGQHYLLARK